jgi:hypothetical protein
MALDQALPPAPVNSHKEEENDNERFKRDPGIPRMEAATLEACCLQNEGWHSPELNEKLILHFKGFRKIENLEAYKNVKSLFLECNGITKIENLECLPGLVSLYLQKNVIPRIENLDSLQNLQVLNLSHNSITRVENLGELHALYTLNLASNKIVEVDALRGLSERPTLKSVDVSQNYIEDGDGFIDIWPEILPDIECLYLHHNPCSRALKDYRRRVISSLPHLRWLDERPSNEMERVGCEAWAKAGGGNEGKEAELKAKQALWRKQKDEKDIDFQNFRRIQEASRARFNAQKEEAAERERLRAEAADRLSVSGAVEEGWCQKLPADMPAESNQPTDRDMQLKSKVAAFLASRKKDEQQPASAEQPESDRAAGTTIASEDAATPGAGDDDFELAAKEDMSPDGKTVETCEVEFTWSSFRDRRLGRLAAEQRYNFSRVAEELSKEFAVQVSAEDCRRRIRELSRPSSAVAEQSREQVSDAARRRCRADAGRAKDATLDPQAVKDASDWFLRKMRAAPIPTGDSKRSWIHDAEANATSNGAVTVPMVKVSEQHSAEVATFSPPTRPISLPLPHETKNSTNIFSTMELSPQKRFQGELADLD